MVERRYLLNLRDGDMEVHHSVGFYEYLRLKIALLSSHHTAPVFKILKEVSFAFFHQFFLNSDLQLGRKDRQTP